MIKNDLISIVVPVYQVEKYISKCIDSIMKQTYQNIEIILIDDGSIDDSSKICDLYASKDKRIRVVHKENSGLSSARNTGISYATGEYIVFIDGDDWVDSQYIYCLYEAAVTYNADIVQCSYQKVVDEIVNIHVFEADSKNVLFFTGKEYSYAIYNLLGASAIIACNKLYRRNLFKEVRFPEGKIHEDEFTIYKVIWKAQKIAVIPDKRYFYRQHKESIMHQPYNENRLHGGEAFKERAEFYKENKEDRLVYFTYKLHLKWIEWQKKLMEKIDEKEKKYFRNVLSIQEECLNKKLESMKMNFEITFPKEKIFPFGYVEKDASIVLYGGGVIGREFYNQVISQNFCKIVLWVDKDVDRCRENGIPVSPIEEIRRQKVNWEYIVIGIEDDSIVGDVIEMLIDDFQIAKEKIVY